MRIEKTGAFLVVPPETAEWQLLLQTMPMWVEDTCKKANITEVFTLTEEEFLQKGWEAKAKKFQTILLLGASRPLFAAEALEESFEEHTTAGRDATYFIGEDGEKTHTGWFSRMALEQEPKNTATFVMKRYQAVTTQRELHELNQTLREEHLLQHLDQGVEIPLFDGILIGPRVTIGAGTRILPGTLLQGNTHIGAGCVLGPNTQVIDSTIGDSTTIHSSVIQGSTIDEQVKIGPMTNLRPGCRVHSGVKIGDFVELKNAEIGANTSISHLSYLGDCTIGEHCNFGCNSITVNYDGVNKHHTTIGNHVFIGCDCSMVAPLTIGDGVYAAAGSTITEDVPPEALVIARARQVTKPDWNKESQRFHKK